MDTRNRIKYLFQKTFGHDSTGDKETYRIYEMGFRACLSSRPSIVAAPTPPEDEQSYGWGIVDKDGNAARGTGGPMVYDNLGDAGWSADWDNKYQSLAPYRVVQLFFKEEK
jgi:hypothetical protein